MTFSGLACATFVLTENDRPLHTWLLFIPPLESTFNQEQCERRLAAYTRQGSETLMQNYMGTTRALPGITMNSATKRRVEALLDYAAGETADARHVLATARDIKTHWNVAH